MKKTKWAAERGGGAGFGRILEDSISGETPMIRRSPTHKTGERVSNRENYGGKILLEPPDWHAPETGERPDQRRGSGKRGRR